MTLRSHAYMALAAAGGLSLLVGTASAQFTDSFEDGLGATRYDQVSFFENGIQDGIVNYGFNYVAAGVPVAPNSTGGDTLGLYVQSNLTDDCSGGAITPGAVCDANDNEGEQYAFYPKTGASFGPSDDYILQFDFYAFVENVGDIFAMTERMGMGINADPSHANWFFSPGPTSGSWFSMNLDGDSGSDIRALEGDASNPPTGTGNIWREILEDDDVEPLLQSVNGLLSGSQSAANPVTGQPFSAGWSTFQVEKSGTTVTWRINANPESDSIFEDLVSFDQSAAIVAHPDPLSSFNITGDSGSDFTSGSAWFGYGDFVNSVMAFGELGGIFDNINISVTNASLLGDYNDDGFVGIEDLNLVLQNWNANVTPGNKLLGDGTGDGFVGIEDLNEILGNWNAGTPPPPGSIVPEPTTLALLGLGGVAMLRRRR